jgi:hypothetical protein
LLLGVFHVAQVAAHAAQAPLFTMKATWAALREEKKISMSYQTFRMHCWRAGIGARSRAISPPEEAPRGRHGSAPRRGDIN